jgi:hypothetical protein
MAISDRDFYASHGLDFDYKSMLEEYIEGVINQAKIEVLTEIQFEIDEKGIELCDNGWHHTYSDIIQQKIDKLRGM